MAPGVDSAAAADGGVPTPVLSLAQLEAIRQKMARTQPTQEEAAPTPVPTLPQLQVMWQAMLQMRHPPQLVEPPELVPAQTCG